MAISDDLILAILSMDAYNRGYGRGLNVTGNIGNVTLGPDSSVFVDATGARLDQPASFFAQAHTLQSGL